jgi:hypothetical protein
MTRELPIAGQTLMVVPGIDEGYVPAENYRPTTDLDEATVITSEVAGKPGTHKIVLDIDLPAQLIPSSTPGHFHLYIDHEVDEGAFWPLLDALVDAGLVEPGYRGASQMRGFTAARLPWVRKGPKAVSSSDRLSAIERRALAKPEPWN